MTQLNTSILWSELFGRAVSLPQYHKKSIGAPALTMGEHAPFSQLVDVKGNPFLASNPLPVQLIGPNADGVMQVRGASIKDFATGSITVTSSAVEVKVGKTALAGRKQIIVQPPESGKIYWGKADVTSDTGFPLSSEQEPLFFDVGELTPKIYLISDGTDKTVKVAELS